MKLLALFIILALIGCASPNNDPAYWGGIAHYVGGE